MIEIQVENAFEEISGIVHGVGSFENHLNSNGVDVNRELWKLEDRMQINAQLTAWIEA